MRLDNKIALITGANRGIGQGILLALAKAGAIVAGSAMTQVDADGITALLHEQGLKGQGFVLDVTDPAAIDSALQAITAAFGAPEILVNNAGITADNLLLRMKPSEWESVIKTDLSAVFYMTRACLKKMVRARWGRIISISSVVAMTGNAGQANYAAAKAGLIGYSKSLAMEVASRNITVNTVAPGFIDTPMTQALTAAQKEQILNSIPTQRLGTVEDIAQGVVFLASADAAYITGETLHINGGMYMG